MITETISGGDNVTEKEKQIMKLFAEVLPTLAPEQTSYLLGYGEGVIAARREEERKQKEMPVA